MSKYILTLIGVSLLSLSANASLIVNCKTKQDNVSAQLQFEGSSVYIQVAKNKALTHTTQGIAIFNQKWNSITADGTSQTSDELKGVKIYFESSRHQNISASIRPYGSTSEILYPGTEGIIVVGMTCDQPYSAIYSEVIN
ncbi:MAG: hypothetical protein V4596_06580 [Bdellovibrionota bacterium]